MRWVIGYTAAICVLLLIIAQSIFIPTFHMLPYFRWHYERHNVPENIGMEKEELMYVTGELLDYMRGRRSDLIVYANFNGEVRSFFSDRDIRHMEDVYELYAGGFIIRNIAFWMLLLLILIMAYFKIPILEVLSRCCREVLVLFLILLGILAAIIAWDWDRAFVVFHELFFNNMYWILTPGTDPLIDMVGHPFFLYISIIIAGLLLLFGGVIILASTLYLRAIRPGSGVRIVARFR